MTRATIFVLGAALMAFTGTLRVGAASGAQSEPAAKALPNGTTMQAELNSSVDSKKAKVGDKIEAHTTEPATSDGKTVVPRGTKLEGHIVEATARSKGDNGSTLSIQFDKAIPKKGDEIPLSVAIMAVAPPRNDSYGGTSGPGADPLSDRGGAAAGGSPMGSSRPQGSGAGASGYPSGGNPPDASGTYSNGSGELSAKSRGVYGMKDLKLMVASSNANRTVLTSEGKSVHLDGGTRLLLIAQTESPSAAPAN